MISMSSSTSPHRPSYRNRLWHELLFHWFRYHFSSSRIWAAMVPLSARSPYRYSNLAVNAALLFLYRLDIQRHHDSPRIDLSQFVQGCHDYCHQECETSLYDHVKEVLLPSSSAAPEHREPSPVCYHELHFDKQITSILQYAPCGVYQHPEDNLNPDSSSLDAKR